MTVALVPRSAVAAIVIGNVLEWYDFAVYGYFVAILGKVFFPLNSRFAGILAAFGVFALGFVGRIGGSLVCGILSDYKGRSFALSASILLMAIATTAIGLLPTYRVIGLLAPMLLIAFRLMQGLSIGGEFCTSLILLSEATMPKRRGFISSLVGGAGVLGFVSGSAIGALVSSLLTEHQLEDWGWRIPFGAGSMLAVSAWIMRRQLHHDHLIPPSRLALKSLVPRLIATEKLNVLRTFLGCALYMSGFYIPFVYLVTGLQKRNFASSLSGSLSIITIALLVLVLLHPLAGILADRIGIRKLLVFSASVMAILVLPIFRLIENGNSAAITGGFVLLAIIFAPINAVGCLPLVLQFSPEIRGTAFALTFNVAAVAFGGLAPLLADLVVYRTGMLSSCGVLLIIAAAASVWAWATATTEKVILELPPHLPC